VEIYLIDQVKPTSKQRAWNAVRYAALYFVIVVCWMLCWEYLWPSRTEKHAAVEGILIKAFFTAALWGASMSLFFNSSNRRLLVTEESITGVNEYAGLWKSRLHQRSVRKGKIRTIREIKYRSGSPKGTLLSERSMLGARMMGFVFIPASLPEYEALKHLAESWQLTSS